MKTDDSTKLNKPETTKDKKKRLQRRERKNKKWVIYSQIAFMLGILRAAKLIIQSSIFYTHLLNFTSGMEWFHHALG